MTGPESLTQFEQISTIGRVIDRPIHIEEISPDETRHEWQAWPAPVVDMLLNAWAAASGQPAFVTRTVQEITGYPARPFLAWATNHATDFRP
jgi:uncharacterized protein YbjT (DUF2867 family)